MIPVSPRARAAAHWTLAALFALFGIWALGELWTTLGTSAGWRSMLVPFLATVGAVSLMLREVQAARRRPVPLRLTLRSPKNPFDSAR